MGLTGNFNKTFGGGESSAVARGRDARNGGTAVSRVVAGKLKKSTVAESTGKLKQDTGSKPSQ
jgi:hypothetical protein